MKEPIFIDYERINDLFERLEKITEKKVGCGATHEKICR
jgi:hypothetical protein